MERLYYNDSYLREFEARVTDSDHEGRTVYLDRTAFYPTSGGQAHDLGTLNGVAVLDVVDEGERIAHHLARPVTGDVRGAVDWRRRFDHMQQHTGQHLLSALLAERYGMPTVSVHLGEEVSTIDVHPKGLTPEKLAEVELRASDEIVANRAVAVTYGAAGAVEGLRKQSEREGVLRIVTIEGLDRSACGGTHVRSTGEVGALLLGKTEKVRDAIRIEFVCGGRAVRRARRDYDALGQLAKMFSISLDSVPGAVATLQARAAEADKQNRRLTGELAAIRGRDLYASAEGQASGVHLALRVFDALGEEARAEAQSFTAMGPGGVYVACGKDPAAIMVACSVHSAEAAPLNAGALLKEALAAVGGRGGGSALMAQGSLPDANAIAPVTVHLRKLILGSE